MKQDKFDIVNQQIVSDLEKLDIAEEQRLYKNTQFTNDEKLKECNNKE